MRRIVLFLIMLLFISCEKDNSSNTTDENFELSENIFPLSVGNWWEYDVFEATNAKSLTDKKIGELKLEITDTLMYKGRKAYVLNRIYNGESEISYITIEDSLIYLTKPFFFVTNYNSPEWPLFFDERAHFWDISKFFEVDGGDTLNIEIQGLNESIVVIDFKNLDCYGYLLSIYSDVSTKLQDGSLELLESKDESVILLYGLGFYQMISDEKGAKLVDCYIKTD